MAVIVSRLFVMITISSLQHRSLNICVELTSAGETMGAAKGTIDVRHAHELSYDDFVRSYMAPNIPVVIRVRSTLPSA